MHMLAIGGVVVAGTLSFELAYIEPAPKSRFLALLRRNVATHLPRI